MHVPLCTITGCTVNFHETDARFEVFMVVNTTITLHSITTQKNSNSEELFGKSF
jgi:hypothetical protein